MTFTFPSFPTHVTWFMFPDRWLLLNTLVEVQTLTDILHEMPTKQTPIIRDSVQYQISRLLSVKFDSLQIKRLLTSLDSNNSTFFVLHKMQHMMNISKILEIEFYFVWKWIKTMNSTTNEMSNFPVKLKIVGTVVTVYPSRYETTSHIYIIILV